MKPVVQGSSSVSARPRVASDDAVEPVDETSERTERWTEAAVAAAADALDGRPGSQETDDDGNADGRVVTPAPPANLCVTVASRIPEMLAESMSLAGDDDPPPPAKR